MKFLGWALIIAGGGLIVVGARKLLAPAAESGDVDYEDYEGTGLPEWEQHLLDVEEQERNAHNLNDGV